METKTNEKPLIDALIFDLDGVVTQTRKLHKKAWKQLFDEFFEQRGSQEDAENPDNHNTSGLSESDYSAYLDGKPRYEGIKSFLDARGVQIPYGENDDPPGEQTVCGLGNRKNELFREQIKKEGAEVYEDAITNIRRWREQGMKTAIVSSSKNCKMIIEQAGIDELFDVQVDDLVSEERELNGKPHPDIFLEAARDLKVLPERCIVFEDAISGVKAGQAGFFGLVVGLSRFENAQELEDHGADFCINDFDELELQGNEKVENYFRASTPLVFSQESGIFKKLNNKKPAFFLDYDGTLTPIVQKPEDAVLSDEMRNTLSRLAEKFIVAVVTGRDKEDVQQFVKLDNIIYSGSHGYITSGPDGLFMEHDDSEKIIAALDQIEQELHEIFPEKAKGVQIDRKRYAIAVHYRNADEKDVPLVFDVVDDMLDKHEGHKKGEGKMVVEIKPDIDWHKGKAVLWIMEALGIEKDEKIMPVFIGDDITDEDAFEAIRDKGIGILVENHGQKTAASYSLKNVYQVRQFFERIISME